MTTNLTPEQIADGWRNISEIVNEPDWTRYETADYAYSSGGFKIDIQNCYVLRPLQKIGYGEPLPNVSFYRRLIPALPNQVVIVERERLLELLNGCEIPPDVQTEAQIKYVDAITRLRAKLEGK